MTNVLSSTSLFREACGSLTQRLLENILSGAKYMLLGWYIECITLASVKRDPRPQNVPPPVLVPPIRSY